MANKWAIQNGNWSDGSTWNDGVVPTADDDVELEGCSISIDTDIICKTIRNTNNGKLLTVGNVQLLYKITSDLICSGTEYILYVNTYSHAYSTELYGNLVVEGNSSSAVHLAINENFKVYGTIIANLPINTQSKAIFTTDYNNTGRCSVFGDVICRYCSLYAIRTISGTLIVCNPLNGLSGGETFNCDIYIEKENTVTFALPNNLNGNIYLKGSGLLNLNYRTINGNVYIDDDFVGTGFFMGAGWTSGQNQAVINGAIYNNKTTSECVFIGDSSTPAYNITIAFNGEIHFGNIAGINRWNNTKIPFGKVIVYDGSIFYKNDKLAYFIEYELHNPSTFEIIYEGEGEPTFEIIPYKGNHRLNYPTEQQVAQGVIYGMQNEYEGRLALPPESTVLKDVEYGDKVGTLEVIALSGATATAENISVVNLTEQEVNRVKNCATVSTVQKCFEDFKE